MPQASEALRREWGGQQGVGEDKAIAYLEDRGWKLTKGWLWYRDEKRKPTRKEWRAMLFLIEEWDYGGWVGTGQSGIEGVC